MKKLLLPLTLLLAVFSHVSFAEDNLKYFMVLGKLKPEVAKMLVDNPADPTEGARKSIESIPGAKLIDYYLEAGTAQNIAIIALPNTEYAAALVYQRMSTGHLVDMQVREIIPSAKFKAVMEIAKKLK